MKELLKSSSLQFLLCDCVITLHAFYGADVSTGRFLQKSKSMLGFSSISLSRLRLANLSLKTKRNSNFSSYLIAFDDGRDIEIPGFPVAATTRRNLTIKMSLILGPKTSSRSSSSNFM